MSEAKLQMGDQGDNRDFNVSETPLTEINESNYHLNLTHLNIYVRTLKQNRHLNI